MARKKKIETPPKPSIKSQIKKVFLGLGVLGILGLTADLLGIISFLSPSDKEYSQIGNVSNFTTNQNNFNVLILPLKTEDNCQIQNTDLEKQISNYFTDNSLFNEIIIKTSKQYNCPKDDKEALEIAHKENAGLVIWGKYDPNCSGDGKSKIRYSLAKPIQLININGNTDFNKVLLNGYLPSNSKFIAEKTKALYLFSIGDSKAALDVLRKIKIEECETDMLLLKSVCLHKSDSINDKFESLTVLLTAVGCIANQQNSIVSEMKGLNKGDCEGAYKTILKAEQYLRNEIIYVSFIKNYDIAGNYPILRNNIIEKEKFIQILSDRIKEIKTSKGWM